MELYTGVKFFGSLFGLNTNDVFAAFSFYSGFRNNNIVYSEDWATNSASGILNNTGQFFSRFGSGFFNGSTYMNLNKTYSIENSTIFLSYQKSRTEDEILISSVTGTNFLNYSGFCLGINDANKLYFKYWNPVEGAFTFTYNGVLSDKNLIILNKTESSIALGHYNNNTFSFEIEEFDIFRNSFAQSNFLYIGGKPNNVEWVTSKNFSGYIDKLYIFNNIDFYLYRNSIASGFFNVVTGFAGEVVSECYETGFLSESGYLYWEITGTTLSGYQTGRFEITGYSLSGSGYFYSGVTGYDIISVGFYTDNCGNTTELFERIALSGRISGNVDISVPLYGTVISTEYIEILQSGLLSGNVLIPETGQICNERIDLIEGFSSITDLNYLSSLSYKEITLYSEVKNNDIVEIFREPYSNKELFYNKNLFYDNFNNNYFYIDKEYAKDEILMFGNGQALIDDGYQLIPDGYEIIRSPNVDYFITGTTVETNKFFVQEDNLFYDSVSGRFFAFKNTGNIISFPNTLLNTNFWVFKNGQKLILNIDYVRSNFTQLTLVNTDANQENYIILKEILNNFNYISGNRNSFRLTSAFNHNCSQVYYNGIKQKINNNYIENSDFDLISGVFYEPNPTDQFIYNNSDDFFV
jgi:hypothetical protein